MDEKKAAWLTAGTALLVGALYIFIQVWFDYLIDVQAMVCCAISIVGVIALYGFIYKMIEDEWDFALAVLVILGIILIGGIAVCNAEMMFSANDIMTVNPGPILNENFELEAVELSIFYKALILTPAYGNTAAVFWLLVCLWRGDGNYDFDLLKWTPIAYIQAYIISLILLAIFSVYTTIIIVAVIIGILALLGCGTIIAMWRGN